MVVVRSLNVDKYPLWPQEKDEELIGPEVFYLSEIRALMYLPSHRKHGISLFVSKVSSCPTQRHQNEIKHVLRYLQGMKDIVYSFVTHPKKTWSIDIADARYLFDPYI